MVVEEPRQDLVARARGGDRDAFGGLATAQWDRLVRLARSVVGELEAEDAVQEGLVFAWQRIDRLREAGRFPAWISRIVFRCCLRRAKRSRGRRSLDEIPEPAATGNPEARIDVWRLLRSLPPGQRAVLHLTVVEGMTDAEIGEALGIEPSSVRSHRRRARQSLERILEGETS